MIKAGERGSVSFACVRDEATAAVDDKLALLESFFRGFFDGVGGVAQCMGLNEDRFILWIKDFFNFITDGVKISKIDGYNGIDRLV